MRPSNFPEREIMDQLLDMNINQIPEVKDTRNGILSYYMVTCVATRQ